MTSVQKEQVQRLIGKHIYAVKKDGTVISGKLTGLKGNRLVVVPQAKLAKTSAIAPLVLFDLLAIGTAPFAFGYGGFGPGFGYGPGFGFGPGFFW